VKRSGSVLMALVVAACATPEPPATNAAQGAVPAVSAQERAAARAAERAKLAVEARALVAQAETDVQRARAKRALWLSAWEDLVAAREALAGNDYARATTRAKHASELAELGLEQLAYPAVK
jgi:hypothetical protein